MTRRSSRCIASSQHKIVYKTMYGNLIAIYVDLFSLQLHRYRYSAVYTLKLFLLCHFLEITCDLRKIFAIKFPGIMAVTDWWRNGVWRGITLGVWDNAVLDCIHKCCLVLAVTRFAFLVADKIKLDNQAIGMRGLVLECPILSGSATHVKASIY